MTPKPERPMMPIAKFKALLGPLADKLTDEQIIVLRAQEYRIADAIIDWWLEARHRRNPSTDSCADQG